MKDTTIDIRISHYVCYTNDHEKTLIKCYCQLIPLLVAFVIYLYNIFYIIRYFAIFR